MTNAAPAPSQQSELELNNEMQAIYEDSLKHAALMEKEKKTPLTQDEQDFIKGMQDKYNRAVTITRILRRTNTGPAKVKETKPRTSKKAATEAAVAALTEDLF